MSQIISITYAYLTISFGFISLYSMSDDIVYLSCFWHSAWMLFSTEFSDSFLMPVMAFCVSLINVPNNVFWWIITNCAGGCLDDGGGIELHHYDDAHS